MRRELRGGRDPEVIGAGLRRRYRQPAGGRGHRRRPASSAPRGPPRPNRSQAGGAKIGTRGAAHVSGDCGEGCGRAGPEGGRQAGLGNLIAR